MFCEKCGCPVEGGQTLCGRCAAEPAVPTEQFAPTEIIPENLAPAGETTVLDAAIPTGPAPAGETTVLDAAIPTEPVPADDTFVLNTTTPTEPKKAPKKKRGFMAAIVAAVVVVACALGAIFNMDFIKGFAGRTFQSPEKYFVDVEKTAIAEYSDDLTQSYGKLLNYYDDEAGEYSGVETEISVALGDEILSLMQSALAQQGTDMDVAWLKDIRLSMNANVQDSTMQMFLSAALGANKLLSADMIIDTEGSKVYAAIPELNEDYLMVDASEMIPTEDLQSAMAKVDEVRNKVLKALPSEEVLNKLIKSYAEVALSGIKNVEKETDTITVGEASQKMVVLTAKITEADMLDIAQSILEKARDDRELEKVLNNLVEVINEYSDEEIELSDEFKNAIDGALEDLEAAKETADRKNYIELNTYVDMRNNVRGRELTVYSEGEKVMDPINWMTAVGGKTTYTKAELGAVEITGEKVENKSANVGFYELQVSDRKVAKVEFETKEGAATTLRLIPSDELMSQLMPENSVLGSLVAGSAALELSYGTDEAQKSFCKLSVLVGSKTLISVNLSAKATNGGKITIPTDAIDALSEDGAAQWLKNVNFDKLLTNLENAGVPGDLVDTLRGYTSLLSAMN